jgi:hypothetical protein
MLRIGYYRSGTDSNTRAQTSCYDQSQKLGGAAFKSCRELGEGPLVAFVTRPRWTRDHTGVVTGFTARYLNCDGA